jgi:lipoprotein-anchoring transpeptidase ErfK/SrfK
MAGGMFALLAACASTTGGTVSREPLKPALPMPPDELPEGTPLPTAFFNQEPVEGEASIVVDLSQQRAYFYKAQTLVGVAVVSTGRPGFATPPGEYKVIERDRHHTSSLYGDFVDVETGNITRSDVETRKHAPATGSRFRGARMPFFLRFYKAYGMHAGRVTGRPASHGCVRLSRTMAEHFYNNAKIGTPVTVRP